MTIMANFHKLENAHLLRMRLEAAGIAAFLNGEHMASLFPNAFDTRIGVTVEVADEDADAARQYLTNDGGAE